MYSIYTIFKNNKTGYFIIIMYSLQKRFYKIDTDSPNNFVQLIQKPYDALI